MRIRGALLLAFCLLLPQAGRTEEGKSPAERFRAAGELVRKGDLLKGIASYRELAEGGTESASLYWNWAQAASAQGEVGEALWAALRARELDPGDGALSREIQRLREAANLDSAEIAPDPLAVLARQARRFHLGALALLLSAASVGARLLARLLPRRPEFGPLAWAAFALACLLGALPLAGSMARPTAVVVRRGAPLFDSASPTASPMGALRLGEVVPVVERSGGFLRVEDSSGARGWARAEEVWPLDQPPTSVTP